METIVSGQLVVPLQCCPVPSCAQCTATVHYLLLSTLCTAAVHCNSVSSWCIVLCCDALCCVVHCALQCIVLMSGQLVPCTACTAALTCDNSLTYTISQQDLFGGNVYHYFNILNRIFAKNICVSNCYLSKFKSICVLGSPYLG